MLNTQSGKVWVNRKRWALGSEGDWSGGRNGISGWGSVWNDKRVGAFLCVSCI